ncbi:MAG: hypothetical protein KDA93_11825 [Planctomycetaceae bacterium]|nr:hypothetical protein [Planctomycetaceae bacterium]
MRCLPKSKDVLTTGLVIVCLTCGVAINVGLGEEPLVVDEATRQAEQLIRQLGAASYELREEAARQLNEMGLDALPALQDAAQHRDLEIRYRVRKLRDSIELIARDRVLIEFLVTGDPALGQLLPGWVRFAEIVGADRPARQLFVDMHQAEPRIMRLTDRSGPELQSVVERRNETFRLRNRRNRDEQMSPATLSVFLFVMLDPACELSVGTRSLTASVIRQPQIISALNQSDDTALRRLMSTWIAKADDVSPTHRIKFAMQYAFRSGVEPAIKMVQTGARANHLEDAILAIGMLGGPEHIDLLVSLLGDSSVLTEKQRSNKTVFSSQVRDVALAVMVYLSGQNPYDYGFTRLRPHSASLFQPNTAGFATDELRARALARWELWTRVQKAQSLPIDATAIEGVPL